MNKEKTAVTAIAGQYRKAKTRATLVYRLLSFWLPMPVGAFLYRKWIISPP